ncbi:diacylglycerol kinase [Amycolatopsis sp. WAC 01375]|uniref:diacylglycerol kinase n=1 Tax=unclassified Amycolatopsis TaxID=2618356 RepID=UPI000F7AE1B3|nr:MULTISPECIES: diacylglycerol kinase [unclassified Amycolatopsis]RSM69356.1 diacylglycerol kinase [Amycolatopsis sp. WAC 01375]RSN30584.1 diacylglycerol kinase [Amycolatopsis sp. WAC 01416]
MSPIRTVALLTNPVAGHGKALAAAELAKARLTARGIDVLALAGTSAENARELARHAITTGVDALVVVGGDGMIHLALQSVVGTSTPLGVIPAGTGNDQAREYGWPRGRAEAAADVVADGHLTEIDVGVAETADGKRTLFGSVLASGFDSLVTDRTNRMSWPHGRARYNVAMLVEFAQLRARPVKITLADGTLIEQDALLVAVGNTKSYGGGMRICPAADPSDGLLDVTIGGASTRRKVLAQFPSIYRGTHVTRPEVRTVRTERLRIEMDGINAYADGDYVGPLPVDVSLLPRAVSVIVPGVVRGKEGY